MSAYSSSIAGACPVVRCPIRLKRKPYDPWLAYGQSKSANSLFAVGLTERWGESGVVANAVHPGSILTDLARHLTHEQALSIGIVRDDGAPVKGFKTIEQGAATSVMLAVAPEVEGVGGRYFEDCNGAVPASADKPMVGVQPWALDSAQASRLWETSEHILAS